MRAHCLFLVCLAVLATPTMSADNDAAPAAADPAAAAAAPAATSSVVAASDTGKQDAEVLDVAESANNNTAAADEDADGGPERSNTKRTIDHNLGYGYRYNTVLRPVLPHMHHHHYMPQQLQQPRRPSHIPGHALPMYKQRFPHHFFPSGASSGSGSSGVGAGAPFRYSQPLPSPPQQQQQQHQRPSEDVLAQQQGHDAMTATRPVTEAPSGHGDVLSLYRTLPQQLQQHQHQQPEQPTFTYEDDDKASKPEVEQQQQQQGADTAEAAQPVQYADDAPHSYQQVLQAEPTYYLTSTAPAAAAAPSMFGAHVTSSPLAAMYGHAAGHAMSPLGHLPAVMYATTPGASHAAATQMIPVIIVRLMDSQSAASLGHAMAPMSPMAHAHAATPYPLVNMQFLRDYLSKLYAPSAAAAAAPQYVTAEPESIMYSSPLYSSTQLQKLQLQQQLHAQLQKQLQAQVQQQQVQQQQQQQRSSSVAALLQEQHRQRVAAAQQQQRTEVTVHRSPAMSPQDYKESVEQQEEA